MRQNKITLNGSEIFSLFIGEEDIKNRVSELGDLLNRDYTGRRPVFIGVLNGAFIFLSDLMREVTFECETDFLKLSSYDGGKKSSGKISLEKGLDLNITDRDVIVVEDIIDSGLSIAYIRDLIMRQNPRSVSIVTLLYKKEAAKIDFPLDYVGFEIPAKFVIGYGLDYAQKYRNLKSIYILDSSPDADGNETGADQQEINRL